jgi:cysteinyl-tRNA synthetase
MEEDFNIMEPIQTLMENVKKDIFLKTANKENKANNKEIINSLFKLLDYQITLINQILLFNQNGQDMNENKNNIDNLLKINKYKFYYLK